MKSGFIAPENLSLMRIVDLPGGEVDNADESKAGEWGPAAVKALKEWSTEVGGASVARVTRTLIRRRQGRDTAFHGLRTMYDTHFDVTSYDIDAYLPQIPDIGRASSPRPISPDFSLFTTIRFTSPNATRPTPVIEKHHVPLVDGHIARLREAHAYFSERDGSDAWGRWPGDEHLWLELKTALESKERAATGDWRVSDCVVIRLVSGTGGC